MRSLVCKQSLGAWFAAGATAVVLCVSAGGVLADVVRGGEAPASRPATHAGPVGAIVTNMGEAARSLLQRRDPGEATQSLQAAALEQLKAFLQDLLRSRQRTKGPARPAKGRLRSGDQDQQAGTGSRAGRSGKGGGEAMQDEYATKGQPVRPAAVDLSELRKIEAWGFLPPDQRREVLQGVQAAPPARYRKLTERYWRLLNESGMRR